MEAVPRLPMISFELLTTTEKAQFAKPLKDYISSFYQEDKESYNIEIHNLESLRASACWPSIDINNCQTMKKYYCQLQFLKSRFPMEENQPAAVEFSWKDDYTKMVYNMRDINFELMCILINIGAIHSKLGAEDMRNSPEGMKMSCTHFQCAAWAFQTVREQYGQFIGFVMISSEQIRGMQLVCLAQAQECILEKSLLDNRKATIIAKIAIQLASYYRQAFFAFNLGDDGLPAESFQNHKYVMQYLTFKMAYHKCIALLYQGQQAEEQQKMGERVAFYQAALELLEDARSKTPKMSSANQALFKDTLAFTLDVIEGKRKAATNENEYIYHEDVPSIESLQEIKGASLVKGIPFNIHDVEVSGPDIFGRLVPMEAHEASSLYSERKAQILREVGERVGKRDEELNEFMGSLQLDTLGQIKNASGLSQDLVDRAAALIARPNATKDLIEAMGKLSNSYQEVEAMLKDIQALLKEEDEAEKGYQAVMGKRPPSIIATDLSREAAKYQEAHGKASESNQNLHKAMTTHVANLKILAQPISQLQINIPSLVLPDPNVDEAAMEVLNNLISKVDQMKTQRMNLWTQLRDGVHTDDITGVLVTRQPEQTLESVFQGEIEKHHKTIALIDQNLIAQDNICKAIVDAYAKFTPSRKYLQEFMHKRNTTVSALIASADTYDDLLGKANKGIEFYAKLETNVSKLLQRIKSACKVQQEEREQILIKNGHFKSGSKPEVNETVKPKLKDYLDSMKDKEKVIGPQMQYPSSSIYPSQQEYVPSPSQSGYTQQYNTSVNSSNYGSYGYTQVNYSDKNIDQALLDRMGALKLQSYYDHTNSQAYNYPVNTAPTTTYSMGATNLHTSASPPVNVANYSNPPTSYQTVSSTNYPYITTSEQYTPSGTNNYTTTTQTPATASSSQNLYNYNQPISSYAATSNGYYQYYQGEGNTVATQAGYTQYTPTSQTNVSYGYPQSTTNWNYPQSNYSQSTATTYPTNTYSQGNYPTENQQVYPQGSNNYPANNYATKSGDSQIYQQNSNYNTKAMVEPQVYPTDYTNQPQSSTGNYPKTADPQIYPHTSTNYNLPQSTSSGNYAAETSQMYQLPQSSNGTFPQNYLQNNPGYTQTDTQIYPQDSASYPQETPSYDTASYPYNSSYQPNTSLTQIYNQSSDVQVYPQNSEPQANPQQVYSQTSNPQVYAPPNPQASQVYTQPSQVYTQPSQVYTQASQVYTQASQVYTQPSQVYTQPSQVYTQASQVYPQSSNGNSAYYNQYYNQQTPATKKESSIDLLAGLDFSISHKPLVPQSTVEAKVEKKKVEPKIEVEKKPEVEPPKITKKKVKHIIKGDPFRNPEILKQFIVEADKFEKYVEALTVKTLSGPSTLDLKWKEVQDCQENMDGAKKSISVARCYPLKNRSPDILPYDYSRVELTTTRDDYINASHVRDIGSYCMDFIVTQAPSVNTINEFWVMVWEQQIETVVCLLSNSELKDESYWPPEVGKEFNIGIKVITTLSSTEKNCWTERKINFSCPQAKESRIITILQFTGWPGSLFPTNPLPFVDFVLRTIEIYEQQRCSGDPVLIHCFAGVGRSGICCVLLAVLMELAAAGHPLPDIPSLACKVSCARKNVLRDREHLKFVYTALASYVLTLKSKYTTKSDTDKAEDIIPVDKTPVDPLSTLDPLWATRKL